MSSAFEKVKSYFRNRQIYKTLRSNPLLVKINQHYRNQAESQKRESLHTHGLEALKRAKAAFQEVNRDFWMDWGTMLGAVREKGFIGHDADADLGTFFTGEEDVLKLERAMKKQGFEKSRQFWRDGKTVEETYLYKGVNLDIFYYYPGDNKDEVVCYCCEEGEFRVYQELEDYTVVTKLTVEKVVNTITGFALIDFKGEQLPIPENFDHYLQNYYGPTYMIKDENWSWTHKKRIYLPFQDNTRAILYKK